MATYQPLETEKYWDDVEAKMAKDRKRTSDRNAIEAFCTFLVGLAFVGVFNVAFHFWMK